MTIQATLKRILLLSGLLAIAVLIVGGAIGYAITGPKGILSAGIGAALALFFSGMTALSVLVGSKRPLVVFFGIVMGTWILKLIIFIILVIWLQPQPWIDRNIVFVSIVVAVVGTLIIDALVVVKARIPYVEPTTMPSYNPESDD